MIYMDNSATSYPKPREVIRAVKKGLVDCYANPGRSSYPSALHSSKELYDARGAVSRLVGTAVENIIFTYNATYALNMALLGFVRQGMCVAFDSFAHNSVLRPLYLLQKNGVTLERLDTHQLRNSVIISSFEKLLKKKKVDALVLTHTSNVTGKKLPLKQLSGLCKKKGVVLIVDASQAIGSCKIDMKSDGIDILASSGHKGLYGIMGTGFLAFRDGFSFDVTPVITGGSGSFSLSKEMPQLLPERFEAGTLGMPGIISMKAGAEYVMRVGEEEIADRERRLRARLIEGIGNISGVRLYNADVNANSIVLFNFMSRSCGEMAQRLADEGVCLRSGFHCAPLAHSCFKNPNIEYDGALRLSVGYFNTERECERVIKAVDKVARS